MGYFWVLGPEMSVDSQASACFAPTEGNFHHWRMFLSALAPRDCRARFHTNNPICESKPTIMGHGKMVEWQKGERARVLGFKVRGLGLGFGSQGSGFGCGVWDSGV